MSRLRVNKLTNKDNNGAPEFVHGVTISGVATATKFKGDGSELTSVPSSFTVLDSGVPSGNVGSLNFGSGISIDSTLNGVATISVDTSNLAPLSGATFVGDISAYNITANGAITSTGDVNAVNVTASGAITSTGSATFAGGDAVINSYGQLVITRSDSNAYPSLTINSAGTTTNTIDLNGDGSATFGPIDISSSTGYGAHVDMETNAATIKAQCQQTASQYTELFAGYMGTNKYFAVNAQGDATFNGTITAGAYSFANLTEL